MPVTRRRRKINSILHSLRYTPGALERFARTVGLFIVFYVVSIAIMILALGFAGLTSFVMVIAFIPICAFLAYRIAHAYNNALIQERKNGRNDRPHI